MKLLMKKIFSWGLMLAATFTLTNCAKEIDQPIQDIPEAEGIPFEIVASPSADTKTSNDGMSTKWVSGDAINVFYAAEGTGTFVNGGEFSITDVESNKFTGTLATSETVVLEDEENYDWYFFYPYSSYVTTPDNTGSGYVTVGGKSQTQDGNDSKAHLSGKACPLYGIANGVTYPETPSATMKHLTSIVAVEVTNGTSDPLIVSSVTFTGTEDIVGTYYIDFYKNNVTDPDVTYTSSGSTYVSSTATLTVTDGEAISAGSSAVFYIAIKPFKAEAGDELTIAVNGGKKTVAMPGDVVFTAGKIKNVKFDFDESLKAPAIPLPWSEDFSGEDPLSLYTTSNVTIYEQALAGGESPEILIGKSGGFLQALIDMDSYSGKLTLSFNANNATRTELSTTVEGVTFSDIVANGNILTCLITVPEGVDELPLTFTNTSGSNVRVDNISLVTGGVEPQEISFANSSYVLLKGSEEAEAFVGQTVSGAKTAVTYSSSNTDVATVDASTGTVTLVAVGETTITATAAETSEYSSATATYEIIYSDKDYVSLPWSFAGGTKSELMSIIGISTYGLGSDYAESNGVYRIKFDTTGDYVIVKTDSAIGALTIGLKMIGGANSSSFVVSESVDGDTFTDIEKLTWEGDQYSVHEVSTTEEFDADSRYVKFTFTKGSNIGVGPISLTGVE